MPMALGPIPSKDLPLLSTETGRVDLLIGNEAIVRGAIEAGVGFACGYPGTPSSEVTDAFARLAPNLGIGFEYSVNEKIALETAYGACLAGTRAIVAMKHLGLLYAGDPLSTIPYMGTTAGLVIVSGGDPSCLTSPNEQDQRQLGPSLHLPVLDPRTPQDALAATRFAFELSEATRLPVLLRPTTRLCHTAAPVQLGPIQAARCTGFEKDPARLLPLPANARRLRVEIEERLDTARELVAASGLFNREGPDKGARALIASGVPAATCSDILAQAGLTDSVPLLSLSAVYPLPEAWLLKQLAPLEQLLVVEELSPFVEDQLRVLCSLHNLSVEILGKGTGHLPIYHEYDPAVVRDPILSFLGVDPDTLPGPSATEANSAAADLPVRPPILCPACPHRSTFFVTRRVFGDDTLYFNDIGCYTLGVGAPLATGDALLCMGAGVTLAAGVAHATGKRTVGFIGDSTFFHSGMPALLNSVRQGANTVTIIMDNEVTAMTGFQESPSTPVAALVQAERARSATDMEAVVRALGVESVETVDPEDLPTSIAALTRARDHTGPSVIIARRPCPVSKGRILSAGGVAPGEEDSSSQARPVTYRIDPDLCQTCGREGAGHRCHQPTQPPFEGAMTHARSLEVLQTSCDSGCDRPQTAACASACPLHLCIQGYAAHIASGNYAGALELILDGLPLPDSVCRVCHRPCEDVCVRTAVDEPVAINDLKRFVMEWAARQEVDPLGSQAERCQESHGKRVAVVGAGPAGLAAAHSLRRRGYAVDLYDAGDEAGGLLRTGIPAYRLPSEVLERDVTRILELGVEFKGGRRLGENLDLDELLRDNDSVLLALGGGPGRTLDLEGQGPAVKDALVWLASQEPIQGNAIVIGGGNSAIDAARSALRRGAEQVTLICLEEAEEMPAIAEEVAEARREGVQLNHRQRACRLVQGGVEIVAVTQTVSGDFAPSNFEDVSDSTETLSADVVLLAIGQIPDKSALNGAVESTQEAGLNSDAQTGATSRDGLFVAGDMAAGKGTVTDAIAAGLRAAWGLDRSLRGADQADEFIPPPIPAAQSPACSPTASRREYSGRQHPGELDPSARTSSFDEVIHTLTEEAARAEAARCMICGLCGNCRSCLDLFGCPAFRMQGDTIQIDPGMCVACGVCEHFCPNGAIHPVFATDPTPDPVVLQ